MFHPLKDNSSVDLAVRSHTESPVTWAVSWALDLSSPFTDMGGRQAVYWRVHDAISEARLNDPNCPATPDFLKEVCPEVEVG